MLIRMKCLSRKLYTRGGDKGETGLFGARRVSKDSPRVEAYGSIDELNSCIGLAVSISKFKEMTESLKKIQKLLFVAGADLAADVDVVGGRVPRIGKSDIERLEREIDSMQSQLPKLTKFILPGGSQLSAQIHLARAVCRRAERMVVAASKVEKINPEMIPFFNRLSTLLFNLARLANTKEGKGDEVWDS